MVRAQRVAKHCLTKKTKQHEKTIHDGGDFHDDGWCNSRLLYF